MDELGRGVSRREIPNTNAQRSDPVRRVESRIQNADGDYAEKSANNDFGAKAGVAGRVERIVRGS